MKSFAILPMILITLAACSGPSDRYTVPAPSATQTQRISFAAVEIRDISLPTYASDDEIVLRGADGKLISGGGVLWADTPDRAVALELSRHLAQITGARIASSPWPFETLPDARLDLRFETLVADEDGQFRANGQYFVAVGDGRRERSGFFDLAVPFDPQAGPSAIAAARGQLILTLASDLARGALR